MSRGNILRLNKRSFAGSSYGSLITAMSSIAFFLPLDSTLTSSQELQTELIVLDIIVSTIFADSCIMFNTSKKWQGNYYSKKNCCYLSLNSNKSVTSSITPIPTYLLMFSFIFKLGKSFNLIDRYVERSQFYRLPRERNLVYKPMHGCGYITYNRMSLIHVTNSMSDKHFSTIYVDALYWTITTMTTVGYGDVVPKTITTKLFTMFIMILGVGSYGIVIAQVSKNYA